jgi:cobalamin synthase
MRDHNIGAYGAVALVLLLLFKTAALFELLPRGEALTTLIVAGALSRWAVVPLSHALPYARREGLGAALADRQGLVELGGATLLALGIAVGLDRWRGLLSFLAAGLLALLAGLYCRRRIGGVTGDTLGATSELVETLVYLLVLAIR